MATMNGSASPPKMSHVNLMNDTIIASLPPPALRSILRSMLSSNPSLTSIFESQTKRYLSVKAESSEDVDVGVFRAMLGCGMVWEAMGILISGGLLSEREGKEGVTDGDIVQATTALQKDLTGRRGELSLQEGAKLEILLNQLVDSSRDREEGGFERGIEALRRILGLERRDEVVREGGDVQAFTVPDLSSDIETFELAGVSLPRLFSGLWQLSSPSWGTASTASIQSQFESYAAQGFTAYDMADHYGDAEILFGRFRNSCANPGAIFGATKYCVFTPTQVTREVVQANVSERCERMQSDSIDLLQFHWQDYHNPQYMQALRYLQEDQRVRMLGLCNFDTQRMVEIVQSGIQVRTNQVQFSLVDTRPLYRMAPVCDKHGVKLLTYGTLCGGFIADKWLGKPEPELFLQEITPSQRKYYEMIVNWGGWKLFQELLTTLRSIATKHNVTISNVATRWVLDFACVGAVIVGTRMGVSGHAEENMKTYGWRLDEEDQAGIEAVLSRSRRNKIIQLLGDCGGEYR